LRDGLIALARDEQDGRRRPVRLTSAGRAAVVRARPYWTEAHRRCAGFFGEPEMAELRATLRDIAENPQVARAFDRSGAPG
jgi:DNA-binding MarR family transcriptional regulator